MTVILDPEAAPIPALTLLEEQQLTLTTPRRRVPVARSLSAQAVHVVFTEGRQFGNARCFAS